MAEFKDVVDAIRAWTRTGFDGNTNVVSAAAVLRPDASVEEANFLVRVGLSSAEGELPPPSLPSARATGEASGIPVILFEEGSLSNLALGGMSAFVALQEGVSMGGSAVGRVGLAKRGTLAALVEKDDGSAQYVLSSAHVIAPQGSVTNDRLFHRVIVNGVARDEEFGTLFATKRTEAIEAALGLPMDDDLVLPGTACFGHVAAPGTATERSTVTICGSVTRGEFAALTSLFAVITPEPGVFFEDQLQSDFLAEPGDSGALLFDEEGRRTLGMAMYSSTLENTTYYNKIANIFSDPDLGVTRFA